MKVILCNFAMRLLKCFLKKNFKFFFAIKNLKNTLKSSILKQNFGRFRNFPWYSPTAQMAEFMLQNVAYRATVCRTGDEL